jgi:hypothetical protein
MGDISLSTQVGNWRRQVLFKHSFKRPFSVFNLLNAFSPLSTVYRLLPAVYACNQSVEHSAHRFSVGH